LLKRKPLLRSQLQRKATKKVAKKPAKASKPKAGMSLLAKAAAARKVTPIRL